MMLAVILSSGFPSEHGDGLQDGPDGLQNAEVFPAGQTTNLAKPIDFGPHFATEDSGAGGAHDTPDCGALCISPGGTPVLVRHGVNAGTSGTRPGDAPTGASCATAACVKPTAPSETSASASSAVFR